MKSKHSDWKTLATPNPLAGTPKVDERREQGAPDSPYEGKLKEYLQAGKEKAIEVAKNPGKSHSDHVEQNIKLHLMAGALAIVTTIVLFVIVCWNEF